MIFYLMILIFSMILIKSYHFHQKASGNYKIQSVIPSFKKDTITSKPINPALHN